MTIQDDNLKEQIIKLFENLLCEGFDELEKKEKIAILTKGIEEFISELIKKPTELELFLKALIYYDYYSNPLNKLKNKYGTRYANFMLILLFSLVEGIMQHIEFKNCIQFLQEKENKVSFLKIVFLKRELRKLYQEYKKKHGAVKRVKDFFQNYIEGTDKEYILQYFENGKYTDINAVVNRIYKIRSKFVHELGFESMPPLDVLLEIENGELEHKLNLNIDVFAIIMWQGILKKFGFNKKYLNVI